MLFSIIVPVYNVEKYIEKCLNSLINQDFDDYEIVLVDDGSTDSSSEICDKYAKKYSYIRVIHKINEGLLLARRTGIKESKGSYIIHCDSDDYLSPNMLKIVKICIDKKHPDMVMFGYNVVDDYYRILERHYDIFENHSVFYTEEKKILFDKLASTTWLNNMVTKVTKRECVDIDRDYRPYKNIKMGEDLFQVIPLFEKCRTFVFVSNPLYHYRFNNLGISKQYDENYFYCYIFISRKMYLFFRKQHVINRTMNKYYNRYIKDIYKYILGFIKNGIEKEKLKYYLKYINSEWLFNEALDNVDKLSVRNRIMKMAIRPHNYVLLRFLTTTLLSEKV